MLGTTIEIIRAGLKADQTIDTRERERLIRLLRQPVESAKPESLGQKRVLSRKEAARRLNCSLRLVDRLGREGVLRRVTLPKRRRAIGFDEASVLSLFAENLDTRVFSPEEPAMQDARPKITIAAA